MSDDHQLDPGPPAALSSVSPDLAARLSELARDLQQQHDVDDTLQGIVEAAVATVPGAGYAGLSVVSRRAAMRTPYSSAPLVLEVDRAQIDLEQGPCLDALYDKRTVSVPDMANEQRWPRFAARAVELGIASMLSFQLWVSDSSLGALNLYAHEAEAFTEDSEHVGLLFAAHAAVAMADAEQAAQLTHARDSRDLIGQAKGILMERHRLTADQAFAILARASQHTNTKLTEIAEHLTRTGELPVT
ncbi:GAF and ANTAR domain-containing protein [Nocardia jiangsuensis]|uniref:GAF and ANTAR domain-containing protein n=1 Tax=Nocardia jiangsuensis TaxID=1691563 RepID=A0ABV8DZK0_9NOCA